MSFVLSEDQQALRDTALEFMAQEAPLSRLRQLRDDELNGNDQALRQKLAENGFFGAIIADDPDGETFGMTGIGQVLEAQGRHLAATPLLQTAVIGASIIELAGTDSQKTNWLPAIAAGEMTTAFAIDETAHHNPAAQTSTLTRDGDAYMLNGEKAYVPDGHHADHLIVLCSSDDGLSLALLPKDSKGLRIQELVTLDSHGAARISMNNVVVGNDQLIGGPGAATNTLQPVLDRACAGIAAETLGSAWAAFDITMAYLKERKQFDQILASFQSLQHRLSQLFVDLELNQSLVHAALSALDNNHAHASELCSMAKASTSDLIHRISNECVQLHGGIGMTDAADPGLFIKRARVQEAMFGSASFHRNRIAVLHGF